MLEAAIQAVLFAVFWLRKQEGNSRNNCAWNQACFCKLNLVLCVLSGCCCTFSLERCKTQKSDRVSQFPRSDTGRVHCRECSPGAAEQLYKMQRYFNCVPSALASQQLFKSPVISIKHCQTSMGFLENVS